MEKVTFWDINQGTSRIFFPIDYGQLWRHKQDKKAHALRMMLSEEMRRIF